MKRNVLHTILTSVSILAFTSCAEDFLDVPSKEIIEAEHSEENATPEQMINGIYGMFTDWNYGFSYLGITEIISDNADKGSSASDNGGDKDVLDNLTYTATAGSFSSMWQHWYKSVGRATLAIEFTENYGLTDESLKNRYIAEARFLRALNYFFLVRGWGDVPIQEQDLIARVPQVDVYNYIENDLKFAIENLPEKTAYASKDLGRATKGAAQGLLSKVYLYQQKWQEALDLSQQLLNSGIYQLEPDYATIWRETTENGPESLFEFQARGESIALGVKQYSQTQGPRGGTAAIGWGFNTPTENLLNAFNTENDEIRRDATIIFRNEVMYDGREIGASENAMYNEKAYSSKNAGADHTDKNIRYLRLGEIYLIASEAANEIGNSSLALQYLNTIRSRVKLPAVTATDKEQLRQLIWKERRLELAFEHDRWFDLVRTKQAATAMKENGKNFQDKMYLFPVPDKQLLQTPEMPQNNGW